MYLTRAYAAALFLMATGAVSAAQTITKPGETVRITATIQQIDSTLRLITFRNADGTEDTVYAGPEVTRFNELKVGDKVNLTFDSSPPGERRTPEVT